VTVGYITSELFRKNLNSTKMARGNPNLVKGVSGNPSGRPAGIPNKNTGKIREAFQKLIEDNLENMTIWLSDVAAEDPKAALDLLSKMAEYTTPKLARVENKHEVSEELTQIKVEIVRSGDKNK
jgi:hypothetical protein